MPDQDYQIQRHYELWKDHTKQMGRWVFTVILLAILIPWKVLHPYLQSSAELEAQIEGLNIVKQNLSGIKNDERMVVKLESQLSEVRKKVLDNSWGKPIQILKEEFRELNRAYHRLRRQNPSEIVKMIDNFAPEQMTAQMRSQMAQTQGPLSAPLQSQEHAKIMSDLALLNIEKAELLTNQISSGSPQHLPEAIPIEEWKALLDTKIRRIPQQMADAAIRNTVEGVYRNAIHPVQEIVEDKVYYKKTDVLRNQIEQLKTQLENWKEANLGQNTWYQTIDSKNSEIFRVTDTLNVWQREFQKSIENKKADLKAEKAAFGTKVAEANHQIQKIEERQERLKKELDSILPEWLKGFMTIEEMFQLYPLAVLFLVGFLGFKASLLRHHFLVIQQKLIPQKLVTQDPSVSSVWTLIYRGPIGTLATALTYLGVTFFLWNFFEVGTAMTETWVANAGNDLWPIINNGLGTILWLGRALFAVCLLGISMSLFSDWKNKRIVADNPGS